ncbi:hypothetical protein HDV03_000130 [Kappamyces sp. JEL0829]|nr:hypothetical protein HDV03_000130 [Kappamyces sp. JEL0829]
MWFAPKGADTTYVHADIREGGYSHYWQGSPETRVWGKAKYLELVPCERFVYLQCFSNELGEIASHPKAPDYPRQVMTTIEFEPISATESKLKLTWVPYEASEKEKAFFETAKPGIAKGWQSVLDNLHKHIASPGH